MADRDSVSIDFDSLQDSLTQLNSAVEDFRPYSEEFVTVADDELSEMESDFIKYIKTYAIDDLSGDKAQKLIENLEIYISALQEILNGFSDLDTEMANGLGGE